MSTTTEAQTYTQAELDAEISNRTAGHSEALFRTRAQHAREVALLQLQLAGRDVEHTYRGAALDRIRSLAATPKRPLSKRAMRKRLAQIHLIANGLDHD